MDAMETPKVVVAELPLRYLMSTLLQEEKIHAALFVIMVDERSKVQSLSSKVKKLVVSYKSASE
jgi:hypothetical protein